MTFYSIIDGDPAIASTAMANWRHVGRLNTDMIPLNNSGVALTDGSLDLGTTTNPWGDVNLAAGKKIYVGGIEFKGGGGGGAGIELLEQKSHLEKSGINYPLSLTDGINESFTNSTNLVITPRVTYVNGTTLVLDYNKTDLDLMNATTGWGDGSGAGGAATVAQNTTQKIEGTGSVQFSRASQNGIIQMVKTFTAFSLVDSLLSFSLYVDTVSNLTRAFVILESSAGNTKTYYIPVANISAATWAHISIDPTNDTADASAGTLVVGGITKIYFGTTTSSAQTVVCSIDFVVTQPNFILPVPYSTYIWDGTNQERLEIASVAGTANHQRRTYTITALSNGYAVGAAYAKERNVTISNNQGVFTAGLAGAVALTSYDITTEHLPATLAGKTLTMSQRFWDNEFKISALPSTTATSLYSLTDLKAYFKTGDKVILYNKRYEGRKYNSRYNSTVGANFKIVTLTGDATYSSPNIALAHTGETNSGFDTSYGYAVRYSAEMLYALEAETSAGALTTLTPTVFVPNNIRSLIWNDAFSSDKVYTALIPNANNTWRVTGGIGEFYNSSTDGVFAQMWAYMAGVKIGSQDFTMKTGIRQPSGTTAHLWKHSLLIGDTPIASQSAPTKGLTLSLSGQSNSTFTLAIMVDATIKASLAGITTTQLPNDTWCWFEMKKTGGLIEGRFWKQSDVRPTVANLSWSGSYTPVTDIIALGGTAGSNAANTAANNQFDDFTIEVGSGYIVRGTVDNLTGSKFTAATKLTRQDTTNQNPIIYQRSAILS